MKTTFERIAALPRIIWPILGAMLLGIPITSAILSARSDLAELTQLKEELGRLNQQVRDPALSTLTYDRLHRIASELQGWQTSRTTYGEILRDAAHVRPADLNWERLVIQNQTTYGFKVPHLAYRPRARSTRIVLSGKADGPASDLLVRTYLETLSETNRLGGIFGKLRYTGLTRQPGTENGHAVFNYSFEATSPSRSIDRTSTP